MKRLTVPLLIMGMIFGYTSAANAGVPVAVVGGIAVASLPTVYAQLEDWGNWWSSNKLTPDQVKQVKQAIDYLEPRGFAKEAKQARGMLNSSLFVYQKPPKPGEEDDTAAVTYGGLKNSLFNDGHITLRAFFGATHDGPIQNLTDEQRTRFQAKTLIHELEHLNTQSNALTHPAILDWVTDREEGPTKKHLGSLRGLGYNSNEIGKIKEEYEINLKPQKFIDVINTELSKPNPQPPAPADSTGSESGSGTGANAPPPSGSTGATGPVSGSTIEPGPEQKGNRPQKRMAETKSGRRQPDTDETGLSKTKEPPRDGSDLGDLSDIPFDPNLKLPHPTPDQLARAGKLGDQAQGGIPGTSRPPGAPTGQPGQPQGGQEVPGARGPQSGPEAQISLCPGRDAAGNNVMIPCPPGAFPPFDPRRDPRGGRTKEDGNTLTKSGAPPTKVAKTPTTPQPPQQQGVRVNCYSACFNGCIANKGGSGYFQGMCAPEGPCYPTRVTPDACSQFCGGYKQDVLLNAGDLQIGVCGGGPSGVGSKPAAPQPTSGATCGPATQGKCTCPGGAKGHIPCDKSMGKCHCGPG